MIARVFGDLLGLVEFPGSRRFVAASLIDALGQAWLWPVLAALVCTGTLGTAALVRRTSSRARVAV